MSLTKHIAKNTIIHAAGKFSGSIIGLIIIGLLTRYLGTSGYGYYTTIFSYLFFFATIGDLGLYLISINELGRAGADKNKIFSNIFTLRFLSGLILMAVASILIWLFPYPMLVKLGTLVGALSVFLMMMDQITVSLFQEQMKTKYVAVAEILGKALTLLLMIILIKMQAGFIYVIWATLGGLALHFIINIFWARKIMPFTFAYNQGIWRDIFKKSWPIATYMIFSMIYFKADTIILSLYQSPAAVGLYGAPYKMLEVLISFPAIFMGLVAPHLARAWQEKNVPDFTRVFQKSFDFLSIIAWPLIFGTLVLAKPIINLIAGSAFILAAPILKILMVATGVIFIAHISTFAIVALNKQKQMMPFYILAAVMALALYFVFIPIYSYWAAAMITVGVEFFILITSWVLVKKYSGLKINFGNNLKALLASMIMAALISLTNFNFFANLVLAIIVYLVCLWAFQILKKSLISEFFKK